jgi:hypothetical protein
MELLTENELWGVTEVFFKEALRRWHSRIESRLKWGLGVSGGTLAALLSSGIDPNDVPWQTLVLAFFILLGAVFGLVATFSVPRGLESAQIEAFPSIAMEQRAKTFFADPTKPTSEESKAFLDSALAMIKEYVETETELWRALLPKKEFLRALKVRVDAGATVKRPQLPD